MTVGPIPVIFLHRRLWRASFVLRVLANPIALTPNPREARLLG